MVHQKGFTLVEILIVLGVIAILAGIVGSTLLRSIRSAELREAAVQVATDLRRARSQAQRGSADIQISWTPDSTPDRIIRGYRVGGDTTDRLLPGGVTMTCDSGCSSSSPTANFNNLTYTAPYGELSPQNGAISGKRFTLRSPMAGLTPLSLRVVGITGKVAVTQGTP